MHRYLGIFITLAALLPPALHGAVPHIINYQGRVAVGNVNFNGSGQFKFALVNGTGSVTYWSNDGSSVAGSQPTAAVTLPVSKGLYAVALGDTSLANMLVIPPTVFTNEEVRLRLWFNDGTTGFQLLTPDQRMTAVGYALMAANVPDGTITASKIAQGSIDVPHLAAATPTSGQVLTASSATTAQWQSPAKPKVDRQVAIRKGIASTSSTTYVDIVSLTTRNMGEAGCYMIHFSARCYNTTGAHGTYGYVTLNINGVDIPATEYSFDDFQYDLDFAYVAQNVPAGAVIKACFKQSVAATNPTFAVNTSLSIDGVPQSYTE